MVSVDAYAHSRTQVNRLMQEAKSKSTFVHCIIISVLDG